MVNKLNVVENKKKENRRMIRVSYMPHCSSFSKAMLCLIFGERFTVTTAYVYMFRFGNEATEVRIDPSHGEGQSFNLCYWLAH
jgi:hypothetical protein